MRFKALRHQPSDAARKSGYDNEGQLPDTLPDSRSRPRTAGGDAVHLALKVSYAGVRQDGSWEGRTNQKSD